MEKLMNHIIYSFSLVIAFSGFIACGELETIKDNNGNNVIITNGNQTNNCSAQGAFVDCNNFSGISGPVSTSNSNQNFDDAAMLEIITSIDPAVSGFSDPLQPLHYNIIIQGINDLNQAPKISLSVYSADLNKTYTFSSANASVWQGSSNTNDTFLVEYNYDEYGISLIVEGEKVSAEFNTQVVRGKVEMVFNGEMMTSLYHIGDFDILY